MALIPFALLTRYSRPYFGMHFPSDVLAGSAFGLASGFAFLAVQRWWRQRLLAGESASAPLLGGVQPSSDGAKAS